MTYAGLRFAYVCACVFLGVSAVASGLVAELLACVRQGSREGLVLVLVVSNTGGIHPPLAEIKGALKCVVHLEPMIAPKF